MIHLILGLALVGFVLYLVTTFIPMDPMILRAIQAVVLIFVVLYLLSVFGLIPAGDLPIPRVEGRG